MRIFVLAAALAAAIVLPGCGGSDQKPGNQAVYDRISATSDCAKLQTEFDTAMSNHDRYAAGDERRKVPLAYAKAAQDRIEKLGCP